MGLEHATGALVGATLDSTQIAAKFSAYRFFAEDRLAARRPELLY